MALLNSGSSLIIVPDLSRQLSGQATELDNINLKDYNCQVETIYQITG